MCTECIRACTCVTTRLVLTNLSNLNQVEINRYLSGHPFLCAFWGCTRTNAHQHEEGTRYSSMNSTTPSDACLPLLALGLWLWISAHISMRVSIFSTYSSIPNFDDTRACMYMCICTMVAQIRRHTVNICVLYEILSYLHFEVHMKFSYTCILRSTKYLHFEVHVTRAQLFVRWSCLDVLDALDFHLC